MQRARNELPLRLLQKSVESRIFVKLKDGTEYVGRLERSDISMNLILSEAMQVSSANEPIANYGKILIRGNNILYISVDPNKVSFEGSE